LFRLIRLGTRRYPEKVARRLRAVNFTAFLGAAIAIIYATLRWIDPLPGRWTIAAGHTLAAAAFLCIPFLHRFGSLAAPIALILAGYAYIYWITTILGTDGGTYLFFLAGAALSIVFFGIEHARLAAAVAASAAALIIALHAFLPRDAGFAMPAGLFYVNFAPNVVGTTVILFVIVFYAVRQVARAEEIAERERERSENLLSHILPPRVAERLKESPGAQIADAYPEASILFADMAGFTARASDTEPRELVEFLNGVFTKLDALVERHGLEKIKTTGDSYMVVSGVPDARPDHAAALADFALAVRDALAGLVDPRGRPVTVRIGIAVGPVVAGVVGTRKFFYDVWGDAVNVASRMESTGEPGKIQVSREACERLKGAFVLEPRGAIEVKGKGAMETWFLVGRRERPEAVA
jgi:adenylate cyclase